MEAAFPHFDDAGVSEGFGSEGCGGVSGRGNTFGHPRYEVIGRIAAARTKLYRSG
jgi:hypothetical protein